MKTEIDSKTCFVIMPISDPDGYDKGHFKKVYEDIFKVSINSAGFNPIRADEVLQTNFIHLDILQKLVESPMAICDLSSRNPNVLFELGLRQAFDMPTVLVQECGNSKIFDIAPMRITEYRKELRYREVLEDQQSIKAAITATKTATDNGDGINSLINLLSLSSPAKLKDVGENDTAKMIQVVMAEMNELRNEFRRSLRRFDDRNEILFRDKEISLFESERARMETQELLQMIDKDAPEPLIRETADRIQRRLYELIEKSNPDLRNRYNRNLKEIDLIMTEYFKRNKK